MNLFFNLLFIVSGVYPRSIYGQLSKSSWMYLRSMLSVMGYDLEDMVLFDWAAGPCRVTVVMEVGCKRVWL